MHARAALSNHQILKDDPDPCFDEDPNIAFLDRQADHIRRRANFCIISGAILAAGRLGRPARAAAFSCQPLEEGVRVTTANAQSQSATVLAAQHLGVAADKSFPEDGNWLFDMMMSA